MPLVKKRIFLAAGATSDQVLAGTTTSMLIQTRRFVLLLLLILPEPQQRQTQQWISPSTTQNLAETHRYPSSSTANPLGRVRIVAIR